MNTILHLKYNLYKEVFFVESILRIRKLNEKQEYLAGRFFLGCALCSMILAFLVDSPTNIYHGLIDIVRSSDVLITDYLEVGGLGATLINSGLLMFFNYICMRKLKLKINGFFIAGLWIITGFAFFGNNIVNVIPIYLGGFLYAKYQEESFGRVFIITIFATSLSPLVTEVYYLFELSTTANLLISLLAGVSVGFFMPVLSAHMVKMHDGFNIYNVGLTSGIIGTVVIALFRGYGYNVTTRQVLSTHYHNTLAGIMLLLFLSMIFVGFRLNEKSFRGYKDLLHYSGRLITDFVFLTGLGLTLINMGIMGLIGMAFVYLIGGSFNGAVIAGLLTLCGFSAFGNHPKNSIPVMVGVFIAALTNIWPMNSVAMVITGLFATTLAPIAGMHGWWAGLIAGFIHTSVVMNIGYLHGGVNLYNNGFAGGIVASIFVPVIDAFKKGD